jgi:hypothetical protein
MHIKGKIGKMQRENNLNAFRCYCFSAVFSSIFLIIETAALSQGHKPSITEVVFLAADALLTFALGAKAATYFPHNIFSNNFLGNFNSVLPEPMGQHNSFSTEEV